METIREKIKEQIKATYVDEFKELLSAWKDLDKKAQNTVALSGVFLGGMLAFVRNLGETSPDLEKILLFITIILLSMSLLSCICVLMIRKVPNPPSGAYVERIANDLLGIPPNELTEDKYFAFNNDQTRIWKKVNSRIYYYNLVKASHLWMAQLYIILSLGVVSITTSLSIF